jgi:hypothetical protein
MDFNARMECEKPRLGNGGDLRGGLHVEEQKSDPLAMVVCEIHRFGLQIEVLSNVVDGPARLGGLLPPLFLIPALLNPIDKLHLGLDERQQVRCVQLAPTLFGHHQQLVRHDQPLRP